MRFALLGIAPSSGNVKHDRKMAEPAIITAYFETQWARQYEGQIGARKPLRIEHQVGDYDINPALYRIQQFFISSARPPAPAQP